MCATKVYAYTYIQCTHMQPQAYKHRVCVTHTPCRSPSHNTICALIRSFALPRVRKVLLNFTRLLIVFRYHADYLSDCPVLFVFTYIHIQYMHTYVCTFVPLHCACRHVYILAIADCIYNAWQLRDSCGVSGTLPFVAPLAICFVKFYFKLCTHTYIHTYICKFTCSMPIGCYLIWLFFFGGGISHALQMCANTPKMHGI